MKSKYAKQDYGDILATMAEEQQRLDSQWANILPIIQEAESLALLGDDPYTFESLAEIIIRLLFLCARIKLSDSTHFQSLCGVFARYLMRQRKAEKAITESGVTK